LIAIRAVEAKEAAFVNFKIVHDLEDGVGGGWGTVENANLDKTGGLGQLATI